MHNKSPQVSSAQDQIAKFGALLSLIEVGLGSLLHSFKIPFSGHGLSLNQGFVLSRATKLTHSKTSALSISLITACLKSLSPAGKKLTPMLAITAQGLLFSIGVSIFGPNLLGALVGSLLLSVWAFLQPVLIYLLLYGKSLFSVGEYFLKQFQEIIPISNDQLLLTGICILSVKAIIAIALSVIAFYSREEAFDSYAQKMLSYAQRPKRKNANTGKSRVVMALKDLFNPLFCVTLALTAIFFFITEHSTALIIWSLLRPIAIGFIMFYAIRTLPFERLLTRLESTRFKDFAASLSKAVQIIKS